jgi:hypothetical protein
MEAQLFWIEPVRAHQPGTLNVEPINLGRYKFGFAARHIFSIFLDPMPLKKESP